MKPISLRAPQEKSPSSRRALLRIKKATSSNHKLRYTKQIRTTKNQRKCINRKAMNALKL
jgi:hypothetical protein